LSNPQRDGITALEKACYLQLGSAARQNGESQAAMNAITAVQSFERDEAASDMANDEFSQVLWTQREHSLAIQHVEEMVANLQRGDSKDRGRQAILLGRIVCIFTSEAAGTNDLSTGKLELGSQAQISSGDPT